MDAVRIEHLWAPALGVRIGSRGNANDADYIRSGKPQYLVEALDQALPRLKHRAASLRESDMQMWIKSSIEDLEASSGNIKTLSDANQINEGACAVFWALSTVSINLINNYLTAEGQ